MLLLVICVSVVPSHNVYARQDECTTDDSNPRSREGRDSSRSSEPCPDETDPPVTSPPPISLPEFSVVLQDGDKLTHVQPGTESVTLASVLLDASNFSKDVHTTKLEFDITVLSFAEYDSLENCGLYHNDSFIQPSGVARAVVTNTVDFVTTSQGVFVYSLPMGALMTPHQDAITAELICDLPPVLTEAQVVTKISERNFMAYDSEGHTIDYSFNAQPSHTVEVYSGDTPPWDPPVVEDPTPGDSGNDGDNGSDGDDGWDSGHRDRSDETIRRR